MADRRGILIPVLLLAFIFLSPDPARPPANTLRDGRTLDDAIAEEQRSLQVLLNSTYSEDNISHVNLTGLGPESGYIWDALPLVKGLAKQKAEYALGGNADSTLQLRDHIGGEEVPFYHNVTGLVHGRWVRSQLEKQLPASHLNLSDYASTNAFGPVTPRAFRRNITGDDGDMRIRFHDRQPLPSMLLNLEDDVLGNVSSLDVEMTITDHSTEHDLRLIGVYFPAAGEALLTTTSDKFAGIFALPHFTLSETMFEYSRGLLNQSISRVIQRQIDRDTERFNPWSPTVETPSDTLTRKLECELIVYLQQLPATSQTTSISLTSPLLSFLERELRFPTGAFLPQAPEMQFSMLIFSPDCGYLLESKGPPDFPPQEGAHLTGPKIEVLYTHGRRHLLFFTAVLALQLVLLMRQMREASTPSTRSRISLYTVAMMALGDGFTFMTFLLVSFFIGGLWVTLMGTAFLAFVSVSFFGMRFLMDIWIVQAPERERRRREEHEEEVRREERFQNAMRRLREARDARNAAARSANEVSVATDGVERTETSQLGEVGGTPTTTVSATTPASQPTVIPQQQSIAAQTPLGTLPLPATAPRPTDTVATPVFMPSDQGGLEPVTNAPAVGAQANTTMPMARESFGSVYTKFYLLLLFSLFLSLNAASWPSGIRRVYFTTLSLAYMCFWIPQINRNVIRNCRKAMKWEFVLGHSLLRLLPFAYFYGYESNVLFAELDYTSLALLGIWVWLQILVLGSQEVVGPRWFVKRDWVEPAYDYHPVLREDEEGATMPIGFSQPSTDSPGTPDSPVVGRERRSGSQGSQVAASRRGSISKKEAKEKGKRVFDCAICMQELEVPVVESGSGGGDGVTGPAGLLARRMYMVTPCRHIFHSNCLEGWMKFRLQCPICREGLPPL